ncbi:LAMI_0H11166g1_1 [Lachancea mirantina]|uniref:LAMI_0H11166g1_1 n=1 Tax=Lachancea mirantina TaxID=1230905 RepID=A0A1G4KH41_9SACH|nr:LAMI_0H11166g1_1 [Lachancea mirantina]
MSLEELIQDLERNLLLPCGLDIYDESLSVVKKNEVKHGVVGDACMLNCGCIISESFFEELSSVNPKRDECPVCFKKPFFMVGPIRPLRNLYLQLQYFKQRGDDVDDGPSETPGRQSLMSLFHTAALKMNNLALPETGEVHMLDNVSNSKTVPIQNPQPLLDSLSSSPSQSSLQPSNLDEEKELFFAKCFPTYRKKSQYSTHGKFLRTRSKLFINSAISPDCTKFALITEHKWEVYAMPKESKREATRKRKSKNEAATRLEEDTSNSEPQLLLCGNSRGEFGPSFKKLAFPHHRSVLQPLYSDRTQSREKSRKTSVQIEWEHLYCELSNDFLVIAGSRGHFRIFDLNNDGRPLYTYASPFPIRCINIDPESKVIACGITGNDRSSGAEQALILLHRIQRRDSSISSDHSAFSFEFPPPITITLPYRDPINTLQFSSDGECLSCSTALESRFLLISLRKISEPRLVMKSLRSIDTSLESEGITDTKTFPGNPNLMCVTSVAFNAPPIVINTKIQTINGVQGIAQPTMLLRLDEVGSKIHKCEISPRCDSIAFLDRNGTVYIMYAPTLLDNEKRRIVAVDVVSNAYRLREAATLKFSPDGHKLFILDRKGTLCIEDFAYALPQDHEVTKCKQIN